MLRKRLLRFKLICLPLFPYNGSSVHPITYMKQVLVCVVASSCALLVLTGCTQSAEKFINTANKYHANKQYQEASILYQKAIAKDKLNAEAYYREGLNLIDDKKPGEAVSFFEAGRRSQTQ